MQLLRGCGIPFVPFDVARSREEAERIARQWPEPVVLKVVSRGILHKSDLGGVRLNVRQADVGRTYDEMVESLADHAGALGVEGILVQPQAEPGIEVMIGVKRDRSFGHVVLLGAGGVLTELLDDVSLRLLPIDRTEARAMVLETRVGRLLEGTRGGGPRDREAVCAILVRLSDVVARRPDIMDVDLNPVVVHTKGATAVDALIGLQSKAAEEERRSDDA